MKFRLLIASLLFSGCALAQTYPVRPVKVIVPWPPGQATDLATPPDDAAAFMKREQDHYATIIKNANIKMEQ